MYYAIWGDSFSGIMRRSGWILRITWNICVQLLALDVIDEEDFSKLNIREGERNSSDSAVIKVSRFRLSSYQCHSVLRYLPNRVGRDALYLPTNLSRVSWIRKEYTTEYFIFTLCRLLYLTVFFNKHKLFTRSSHVVDDCTHIYIYTYIHYT